MLVRGNTWLQRRHTKVLDNAYSAAKSIRVLENQYCQGSPITDKAQIGRTVYEYARSLCDRQLLTIRNNLTQFKINSFLLGRHRSTEADALPVSSSVSEGPVAAEAAAEVRADTLVEKLRFIESVIEPYRHTNFSEADVSSPPDSISQKPSGKKVGRASNGVNAQVTSAADSSVTDPAAHFTDPAVTEVEQAAADLARSGILGSFSMNKEKTARYEQQVVQELRQWQQQSKQALRWLAILLFVPIIVAVLAKQLVFGPVFGNYSDSLWPTR